jgi:dihydroneopterin aldolase
MQTVHLRDLKFFALHGVHDEEKLTGNEFEVNLSVVFDQGAVEDDLARTVDYVHLFKILKYPFVKSISIDIWKLNPPIEQFDGKVGISLSKTFASE